MADVKTEIEESLAMFKSTAEGILRTQGWAACNSYLLQVHRLGDAYDRRVDLQDYLEELGLAPFDVDAKMKTFGLVGRDEWPICRQFDAETMRADFISKSRAPFSVTLVKVPAGVLVMPGVLERQQEGRA
jgi:hypothetical protein